MQSRSNCGSHVVLLTDWASLSLLLLDEEPFEARRVLLRLASPSPPNKPLFSPCTTALSARAHGAAQEQGRREDPELPRRGYEAIRPRHPPRPPLPQRPHNRVLLRPPRLPSPSPRALLLPPSISFWLANCPDPQSLRQSADPLRLADRNLVLFPVNSNLDVTVAGGGSHWSLLVYCREAGEFVHHDSCRGVNRCHAERLFHAVGGFVDDGGEPPRFVEGFTPQQTNQRVRLRVVCDGHRQSGL
ncbi:hypothetical protein GW17_00059857 [Ensete ventricosum]|nr:hypothetical protein GW17_00059857 [Ensete ventricosum]